MKKLFYILMVISILTPLTMSAQKSYFSVHAGPVFPLGDFGDDDTEDEDAGWASIGLGIGGKYVYMLDKTNLGLFAGIDIMLNGLVGDVKDDIEDSYDDLFGRDFDGVTFFNYINVPIMTGINYQMKINNQISAFGEVGLGLNVCKLTNMVIEVDNEEAEYVFEPSTKMAFKFGGGLEFNSGLSVELFYNSLGKHRIDGEATYDRESEKIRNYKKMDVGVFTISVAKRF